MYDKGLSEDGNDNWENGSVENILKTATKFDSKGHAQMKIQAKMPLKESNCKRESLFNGKGFENMNLALGSGLGCSY